MREVELSGELAKGVRRVLKEVEEPIQQLEKRFAEKLQDWTKGEHESSRLICIEDVLSKVVVPVSKEHPTLLLVLDGMSTAVFWQLVRDIELLDWTQVRNAHLGIPCPVLSTLPSVTQVARRALFLGKLEPKTSGTEKGEFQGNDFLFQASGSEIRPRLFLKGDLQEAGHGGLATEVRETLANKGCRIVSIVVNAIDDHLDSGDQVVFTWGMDRIKPLREILKLARESGRLVILTSDHGHILDFGTTLLAPGGESGDRYRLSSDNISDGEMIFEGSRVEKALGQKKVGMPWSDRVRYAGKRRGYHGGANPQEMVAPLAIFSNTTCKMADKWEELPPYEPAWWRVAAADVLDQADKTQDPKKLPATVKGLELFEQVRPKEKTAASWIVSLLESDLYQQQSKLAVRGGPSSSTVESLLNALEARGGSIMKPALAQALGAPLFRVDGIVQNISRILNVDGYDVLVFDRSSDTITLNIKLLKTQFELE